MFHPSRRMFTVQKTTVTDTAIETNGLRDLYAVLGEERDGAAVLRLHVNPLAPWIWLGALVMAAGGALSLADRRLRIGAPARRSAGCRREWRRERTAPPAPSRKGRGWIQSPPPLAGEGGGEPNDPSSAAPSCSPRWRRRAGRHRVLAAARAHARRHLRSARRAQHADRQAAAQLLAAGPAAQPGFSSADVIAAGRPTLVNFFASWCIPCVRKRRR